MNIKQFSILISALLLIIGGVLSFNYYNKIYKPNTVKEGFLFITKNSTFKELQNTIRPFLKRVKPFTWVAKKKNYPKAIKPGKYLISKGMNNNELVNLLRSGKQTPVKLTFNNQDNFEKLAGRVSKQIETDSISLLNAFTNISFITNAEFNKYTALAMYIPNSYEFYWNTSAKSFRKKMLNEYHKFWNTSRLDKANKINLSQNEVITLASIVQKETAIVSERPMVARLYLNRLRDKWPLQADPTIIFAIKKELGNNTIIKRVLAKDLTINSLYNTYQNNGLPPGPIAMPDISSIDAVLNPATHEYYYMCASITNIGKHEFAKTLAQHNRNANKYQSWLSKQGINR